jgi:hypothetical protein
MSMFVPILNRFSMVSAFVSMTILSRRDRANRKNYHQRRPDKSDVLEFHNPLTYSDWVIHRMNGHLVDEVQQIWANELLLKLQYLLRQLSEDPNSPRLERKSLNAVTQHRSILKRPASDELLRESEQHGSGNYLRSLQCRQCGYVQTSQLSVEGVIAGDVVGEYLLEAYQSREMVRLVDTFLDGEVAGLEDMRRQVTSCAEKAGIAVHDADRKRDLCVACNSDDTSVSSWALRANGELRFEIAAFSQTANGEAPTAGQGAAMPRAPRPAINSGNPVSQAYAARLWGIAIAFAAFCVMTAELRYLTENGVPDATGSIRGNWWLMILLGLPWVVLVAGTLQALSGVDLRQYDSIFSNQTLPKRVAVSIAAVGISIAATVLAATIA